MPVEVKPSASSALEQLLKLFTFLLDITCFKISRTSNTRRSYQLMLLIFQIDVIN